MDVNLVLDTANIQLCEKNNRLHDIGVSYPMARHGVPLDLPLSTIYLMKYSIPDCGIPKTLHT